MPEYKNIIFDLDDTLLDTFGQLVKPASTESCHAMIQAGLNCTLDECLQVRKEVIEKGSRENVFLKTAEKFGSKNDESLNEIVKSGENAFYKRQIKENIKLFPDAKEVLVNLKNKYRLFLITIGDPATQREKILMLGIKHEFEKIFYVNGLKSETKKGAFEILLEYSGDEASSFVSIGNRLDTDVGFAKELGMAGVLFQHGEYLHLKPKNKFEHADHTVKNLKEFEKWLRASK